MPKFCPECGAGVEAAKFCPECGTSLGGEARPASTDDVETEQIKPVGDPPTAEIRDERLVRPVPAPLAEGASRERRRGWVTALGLGLFLLLGGFLLGRPGNDEFFTGAGDVAQGIATGAIVALVALLIFGSLRFGIARIRKRDDAAWSRSTFALGTMGVTLVFLVLSFAGRVAQDQEDLDAASSDSSGSTIEQRKARQEMTAWFEFTRGPIQEDAAAAAKAHLDFLDLFEKQGNTPRVEARAKAVRDQFADLRGRVISEMPNLAGGELEPLAEDLERVFTLYVEAYRDYVDALEEERDDLLRAGDRKFQDASAVLRSITKRELEIAERIDAAT